MSEGARPTLAALALAALVLAGLALAPPAAAQEPGEQGVSESAPSALAGRVVHGVEGAGIGGAHVELHRVTSGGGAIVDSATAGEDGSFRFRLSDDESRPIFIVAARHQGVRYFGPALHAGLSSDGPYEVPVYDTMLVSTPPGNLRVGVRHIVVTPGPGGGLDVAEVFDIVGADDRTLVPAGDTVALWSTALPEGATEPTALEGGVPSDAVEFADGRVQLRSMIAPAGVRLSYTYGVPDDRIELPIEHPVDRVELVVASAEAEVEGATHAETTTRDGRVIHRYEGASLEPGETLGVRLVARGGAGGGGVSDRWVWIWAAIGGGLLAAAGALWWTGRAAG